ncbi:16S rRNA (uracil(1498)-N(3))-methyltransferase [Pedobacter aquae]|uniref:Ribosomal RNA small subunit methyltransferase E n=1 Tax=Pedobacter aquae TaxID=2605747 RepID=A0A5C0VJJ4_9SPHI|nr:16S rRNA (uracil(1498)-N(3))-methyltransferase [Pedobacter aquae]QEK52686.1 16S rRNA (uracil(1498)-N(3))-methyltransferase [Pedobacter aquae]
MHIFYTPDIDSTQYTLSEEESKHCSRVLRLQKKNLVHLVDGKGGLFVAEILDDHPKRTVLQVLDTQLEYQKRNHHLHIAIAPTKNMDRLEWFLEKATEIGIDEITPIICERSERKEVKTERLEKVVVAAMKQSLKAYIPKINEPITIQKLIAKADDGFKYIAHCLPQDKQEIKDSFKEHQSYTILIGPEGDFSEIEINNALQSGFLPITLGNSRLRTETAALQACFEINYLNR